MHALPRQASPSSSDASTRLRAIGSDLAAPSKHIEATFVTVGARLAEGAAALNQISKVFEALPAELASPELEEAMSLLAEVGRRAQTMSVSFATEQADLSNLVEVVVAADHPISNLRRAIKMMGIVAINARVVAASIVGDGDDFDVFTHDIATLSADAGTTLQDFTAVYRQLTEEVHQAARQRSSFQHEHDRTLSDLSDTMEAALAEVARQRAISVENSAQTGRVSRQIVVRIASAVMALQVGDATRQRIEHVEAGIDSLCDLLDGGSLAEDDEPKAQSVISGLLAAQLAAANDAFESNVSKAATAVVDLSADAGTIMVHSRSITGDGGGSPLGALRVAVRDATLILKDCEAERSKLEMVANAVLRTVGSLLTHVQAVQEIEANMRLVSLNATVKCAQLGPRGAALSVIARQLRELTDETVVAAEAAMAGLDHAGRLAKSFGAAAIGSGVGRVGQLEHEASAALLLLQDVDRSLAEALGALERDGPHVIGLLGHAAEAFVDQATISESMRDLALRLVAECPSDIHDVPDSITGLISDLCARYTMDAEREIHDQMLGRAVSFTQRDEPVLEAEAALDDLLF